MMELLKYAKIVEPGFENLEKGEQITRDLSVESKLYFEDMVREYLACGFSIENIDPLGLTTLERFTLFLMQKEAKSKQIIDIIEMVLAAISEEEPVDEKTINEMKDDYLEIAARKNL